MYDEKRALTKQVWSKHCQIDLAERIFVSISNDMVPCWCKEMINLTSEGEKCCEMGCGTGRTSAYLEKYNRIMTSIDYSEDSIILVNKLSKYIEKLMQKFWMLQKNYLFIRMNLMLFFSVDF